MPWFNISIASSSERTALFLYWNWTKSKTCQHWIKEAKVHNILKAKRKKKSKQMKRKIKLSNSMQDRNNVRIEWKVFSAWIFQNHIWLIEVQQKWNANDRFLLILIGVETRRIIREAHKNQIRNCRRNERRWSKHNFLRKIIENDCLWWFFPVYVAMKIDCKQYACYTQ